MPCECNIIFNSSNSSDIFYSGQVLSGTAVVSIRNPKVIKGIHIIIKGFAKVKWNEGQFKIFEANRNFVGKQQYLLGDDKTKPFELPAGCHKYAFEFLLPNNLPSSIKTKHGRIDYEAILTVVNPRTINNVFIKPFEVKYPLDLDLDPAFQLPILHRAQCNSWWSACGPQIIHAIFSTKTTGFQIGSTLPFKLIVENNTTYDCKNVVVKLRKLVRHYAKNEIQTLRNTISEKSLGIVRKLSVQHFDDELNIPTTQSSSLDTCEMMETCYKVQILIFTPNLHEDLVTTVPVILGQVEFGETLIDVNVIETHL